MERTDEIKTLVYARDPSLYAGGTSPTCSRVSPVSVVRETAAGVLLRGEVNVTDTPSEGSAPLNDPARQLWRRGVTRAILSSFNELPILMARSPRAVQSLVGLDSFLVLNNVRRDPIVLFEFLHQVSCKKQEEFKDLLEKAMIFFPDKGLFFSGFLAHSRSRSSDLFHLREVLNMNLRHLAKGLSFEKTGISRNRCSGLVIGLDQQSAQKNRFLALRILQGLDRGQSIRFFQQCSDDVKEDGEVFMALANSCSKESVPCLVVFSREQKSQTLQQKRNFLNLYRLFTDDLKVHPCSLHLMLGGVFLYKRVLQDAMSGFVKVAPPLKTANFHLHCILFLCTAASSEGRISKDLLSNFAEQHSLRKGYEAFFDQEAELLEAWEKVIFAVAHNWDNLQRTYEGFAPSIKASIPLVLFLLNQIPESSVEDLLTHIPEETKNDPVVLRQIMLMLPRERVIPFYKNLNECHCDLPLKRMLIHNTTPNLIEELFEEFFGKNINWQDWTCGDRSLVFMLSRLLGEKRILDLYKGVLSLQEETWFCMSVLDGLRKASPHVGSVTTGSLGDFWEYMLQDLGTGASRLENVIRNCVESEVLILAEMLIKCAPQEHLLKVLDHFRCFHEKSKMWGHIGIAYLSLLSSPQGSINKVFKLFVQRVQENPLILMEVFLTSGQTQETQELYDQLPKDKQNQLDPFLRNGGWDIQEKQEEVRSLSEDSEEQKVDNLASQERIDTGASRDMDVSKPPRDEEVENAIGKLSRADGTLVVERFSELSVRCQGDERCIEAALQRILYSSGVREAESKKSKNKKDHSGIKPHPSGTFLRGEPGQNKDFEIVRLFVNLPSGRWGDRDIAKKFLSFLSGKDKSEECRHIINRSPRILRKELEEFAEGLFFDLPQQG